MAVCLNHTGREATTKCATCFKPLCDECAKPAGDQVFCSETCQQNYVASKERIDAMHERDRARKRRKLIQRLIILIILVAAGVAAYVYLKQDPDLAERLKKEAQSLEKRARDTAKEVGDKVGK